MIFEDIQHHPDLAMALSLLVVASSYLYALWVMHRKKIGVFSNFTMFLAFSFIYIIVPVLVFYDIYPSTFWTLSLNKDTLLVTIHVAVSGFANICYVAGMSSALKKPSVATAYVAKVKFSILDKSIFLLFAVLSIAIAVFGAKYSWGAEERDSTANTLLGQGKVILSGIYVYFLAAIGLSWITGAMLFMVMIVTVFEKSRTTFIAMVFGTMVLAYNDKKLSLRTLLIGFLSFLVLVVYFASYRLGFSIDNPKDFLDLTFPIYMEGAYGSYMNLQVYDLILKGKSTYTFFMNYVIDPLVYLLPRVILSSQSIDKDSLTVFGAWIERANLDLSDAFAPYGGFFYVAEASAALPFVGPLLVAFVFGRLSGHVERNRSKSRLSRLLYVIFTIGFAMVFIKHHFSGASTFYVTTFLTTFSIYYADKILKGCCAERYQSCQLRKYHRLLDSPLTRMPDGPNRIPVLSRSEK